MTVLADVKFITGKRQQGACQCQTELQQPLLLGTHTFSQVRINDLCVQHSEPWTERGCLPACSTPCWSHRHFLACSQPQRESLPGILTQTLCKPPQSHFYQPAMLTSWYKQPPNSSDTWNKAALLLVGMFHALTRVPCRSVSYFHRTAHTSSRSAVTFEARVCKVIWDVRVGCIVQNTEVLSTPFQVCVVEYTAVQLFLQAYHIHFRTSRKVTRWWYFSFPVKLMYTS